MNRSGALFLVRKRRLDRALAPTRRQLDGAPSKTGARRMKYRATDIDAETNVPAFSIALKAPAAASLPEETGCCGCRSGR